MPLVLFPKDSRSIPEALILLICSTILVPLSNPMVEAVMSLGSKMMDCLVSPELISGKSVSLVCTRVLLSLANSMIAAEALLI